MVLDLPCRTEMGSKLLTTSLMAGFIFKMNVDYDETEKINNETYYN